MKYNEYEKLDKIIRDPVHDYVSFAKFEQEIIDTPEFQRLKDIRQLTCQHVYPAAKHTRFEHSLGVMELTRQCIKHLRENGAIGDNNELTSVIKQHLCKRLVLLTEIAALLHDIGHCPFSHMGEAEMDCTAVSNTLLQAADTRNMFKRGNADSDSARKSIETHRTAHELLSCIVILEKYQEKICELLNKDICDDSQCDCNSEMDTLADALEYIVRCVLGIPYTTEDEIHKLKNLMIGLINSPSLDMDKLDYIMRDSFYTAIGAPAIDAKRLFRNMYFDSVNGEYRFVYTSKAVPVFQNLIEARDSLYMWVYNHHAVVYSDFIYSYIFRRLTHNYDKNCNEACTQSNDKASYDWSAVKPGMIPRTWMFSVEAIVSWKRSDADVLAVLNAQSNFVFAAGDESKERERRAIALINNLQTRDFLKPWWKTVYEFEQFMSVRFPDEATRDYISKMVCDNELGDEFRSQIAKLVIFIVGKLHAQNSKVKTLLDGDFFVVQRSNKFFEKKTIEDFLVYIKDNEIVGNIGGDELRRGQYYGKHLTTLLPYKDYEKWYGKDSFYVYMKRLPDSIQSDEKKHYKTVEGVFVFVAGELAKDSRATFCRKYKNQNNADEEERLHNEIWDAYAAKQREGVR
jgi:HD superfamily phosphohydrolase